MGRNPIRWPTDLMTSYITSRYLLMTSDLKKIQNRRERHIKRQLVNPTVVQMFLYHYLFRISQRCLQHICTIWCFRDTRLIWLCHAVVQSVIDTSTKLNKLHHVKTFGQVVLAAIWYTHVHQTTHSAIFWRKCLQRSKI